MKQILACLLCAAILCGFAVVLQTNAQQPETTQVQPDDLGENVVYGVLGETTFVPAGYTYVYEGADGQQFHHQVSQDTYASAEVLTAEQAAALANLKYGEGYMVDADGKNLIAKEFDAQEAVAYSEAVQAILSGTELREDDRVMVLCEAYTSTTPVRAMITFEDEPVIRMEEMSVSLSTGLGEKETEMSHAIETSQLSAMASIEKAVGYDIEIHGQFSILVNAVAATVNYGDLAAISKMEGVKSAILMPSYDVPDAEVSSVSDITDGLTLEPNMVSVGPGMGANQAWNLGYDGEGMSVAIIDTGISLTHPFFAKEPTNSETVAYTKDDISDILDAKELNAEKMASNATLKKLYYSAKIPFGFDYGDGKANYGKDTSMGHGSHVAGIVAGNTTEEYAETYGVTSMGIAPEAQLIVMKVFDSQGYGYLDYIIAAMEDAIMLGVDCANLSLGVSSGPAYFEDFTEVFDAAYEAGINVVASAGNEGHVGLNSFWGDSMVKSDTVSTGTVGMPGTFDSVLTVASAENSSAFNVYGSTLSWYSALNQTRSTLTYYELIEVPEGKGFRESLKGQSFEFTNSFEDAKGKLLFCDFAGGDADEVIEKAAKAGAVGLVLCVPQDPSSLTTYPTACTATRFDLPFCTAIAEYYTILRSIPEGTMRVDEWWNPTETAGEMSSFSSWGPTESLDLKPEITGIGGQVFSAYYGTNVAVASGTSMSSPAVAASAALLRQYLRENKLVSEKDMAHVVNCLLMSTATPIFDEEHGTYYFVRRQGAGMANIGSAMASGAYITVANTNKAKLELGDDPEKTGVYNMTFNVVNISNVDKTYTLDVTALGQKADGGQIKNDKVTYLTYEYARDLDCTVASTLEGNTLTVPAGSTVEITVTLSLTEKEKYYYDERFPAGAYVEGFIRLLSDDTTDLTVPFLGFYGDFDDAPILETGNFGTLLGGDRSYYTADQAHSGLFSYKPFYDEEELSAVTAKHYLGDSFYDGYDKVPEDDIAYAQVETNKATVFYPEMAGISPNGDGYLDQLQLQLGLRRNVENIHYTVTNRETGEILWEQDTGWMYKTYSRDTYAGAELSLEWLYPTKLLYGVIEQIDYSRCRLAENTWIEIRADVTPEGGTEATESISFPVYIDLTTVPGGDDGVTFGYNAVELIQGYPPYDQVRLDYWNKEYWFTDTERVVVLSWYAYTQQWSGIVLNYVTASYKDPKRDSAVTAGGTTSYASFGEFIMMAISQDYAGNIQAVEVRASEMLDYIDIVADKTVIDIGQTAVISDVNDTTNFHKKLGWRVSDPTIAEIVETTDGSVTIRGLAPGTVTVSGGYFGFTSTPGTESVEIRVIDSSCEHDYQVVDSKDVTCTEDGYKDYVCSKCGDAYHEDLIAEGHKYDAVVTKPTCTEMGYTTYTCSACKDTYVDDYVNPAGHNYEAYVTAPTCTEKGYTTYVCVVCGDNHVSDFIGPMGHTFGEWEVVTTPGCEVEGQEKRTCAECGETEYRYTDSTGHNYEAVVTAPTCTEPGYTTYTCVCGESYVSDMTPAKGHNYEPVITAPTCTESGYTTYTCVDCGDSYTDDIIASIGHDHETVVVAPTCTEHGYTNHICAICGDAYVTDYVPATGHTFGEWMTTGQEICTESGTETRYCAACDETETREIPAYCPAASFSDLDTAQWYHEGVCFALRNGLMNGMSETTFAPNANMTRAQLVTVLYRLAGNPSVEGLVNPFADVADGQWYTDAIVWAASEGIVKGMTADTFQPNMPVSRQQFATFLYRYADSAGEDVTARADLSAYTDADAVQDYAADAMSWAVAEGYIQGIDKTTLSPDTTTTRAQAATILMRYLTK